ncbi:MAG: GrlR family regulatory protein [Gallionella sp.]
MLEALWSVDFKSSFGMHGNGVVVFETGRLFGGDSTMIYVGSYKVEHGIIHAEIEVRKYTNVPGMVSVVGLDTFNLTVNGPLGQHELLLSGHVVEDPSRKITIKAIRRAELP